MKTIFNKKSIGAFLSRWRWRLTLMVLLGLASIVVAKVQGATWGDIGLGALAGLGFCGAICLMGLAAAEWWDS